jgi:hypothetical protein
MSGKRHLGGMNPKEQRAVRAHQGIGVPVEVAARTVFEAARADGPVTPRENEPCACACA